MPQPTLTNSAKADPTKLDYDAANTSTKRYSPPTRLKSTDQILTPTKRKQLISNARDLQQNFTAAAWAISLHLDYVSRFTFEPQTGDEGLDRDLQALMDWYQRPENCDVSGRHTLSRMIRMCEERRTVDGDVFLIKLRNGKLQPIEADRIKNPDKVLEADRWIHGIRVSDGGRPERYAVWRRDGSGGYDYERSIAARNVYQLGYYDRFDQIRGVSPLAPAINTFRDLYESYDYALAKLKVSQMFGLVLSRESADGWGDVTKDDSVTGGYKVDFGKGPVMLDLDPGDHAEILESKNPSNEFQTFSEQMTALALKSLSIPMSFFDTSRTNFFGSRAGHILYEKACKTRRADLIHLLDRITGFRMKMFINDGTLRLPSGMTLTDLNWEWMPDGTPWWNPQQEINADIAAINAGLKTRTQIVRERHGKEFRDVIDTLAAEQEYMNSRGVIPDMSIAEIVPDEVEPPVSGRRPETEEPEQDQEEEV